MAEQATSQRSEAAEKRRQDRIVARKAARRKARVEARPVKASDSTSES
ncbi:hypothetical protein [Methylobacterium sp. Leaf93]|nr:hypothetical protein [Methylobacterium sp. Leaf93]